jgi:hypothetical protein
MKQASVSSTDQGGGKRATPGKQRSPGEHGGENVMSFAISGAGKQAESEGSQEGRCDIEHAGTLQTRRSRI